VADLLCQMPEHHRFVRGMVAWIGGRQVPLLYDRMARQAGATKYPLRHMLRFAADAITGFSRRPLQIATGFGILAGLSSALLAVYSMVGWALGDNVPGWTSLMSVIGFYSALQFFMLGLLGEYIGRLYEESRGRPLFLEAGRIGLGLRHSRPDSSDRSFERSDLQE
jgi:dolichol-phosphate mannosyltransferase